MLLYLLLKMELIVERGRHKGAIFYLWSVSTGLKTVPWVVVTSSMHVWINAGFNLLLIPLASCETLLYLCSQPYNQPLQTFS